MILYESISVETAATRGVGLTRLEKENEFQSKHTQSLKPKDKLKRRNELWKWTTKN